MDIFKFAPLPQLYQLGNIRPEEIAEKLEFLESIITKCIPKVRLFPLLEKQDPFNRIKILESIYEDYLNDNYDITKVTSLVDRRSLEKLYQEEKEKTYRGDPKIFFTVERKIELLHKTLKAKAPNLIPLPTNSQEGDLKILEATYIDLLTQRV